MDTSPAASPSYAPTGDLLRLNSTSPLATPLTSTRPGSWPERMLPTRWPRTSYFGIRMRVRNVGDPGSEPSMAARAITSPSTMSARQCPYDNVTHQPAWRNLTDPPGDLAVYLVDIQQLLGPNGCGQISKKLTVLFTAAHPNLGSVSLRIGWAERSVFVHARAGRRVEFRRLLRNSDAGWVRRRKAQTVRISCYPHGQCLADRWRQRPWSAYRSDCVLQGVSCLQYQRRR